MSLWKEYKDYRPKGLTKEEEKLKRKIQSEWTGPTNPWKGEWDGDKPKNCDWQSMAYIQIALSRADKAYQAAKEADAVQYPNIRLGLEGVDPCKRFCCVDMGFTQRMERLKMILPTCPGKNRAVLNRIFRSGRLEKWMGAMAMENYCREIWRFREAAKYCPNPVQSPREKFDSELAQFVGEALENHAAMLEKEAEKNVPAVRNMEQLLTLMEQVAGIKEGPLDQTAVKLCQDSVLSLQTWNAKIPTGSQVQRDASGLLEIQFPQEENVWHILMQEAVVQPENLGKSQQEVAKGITKKSQKECMQRCADAVTRDVLTTLFGKWEQGQMVDLGGGIVVRSSYGSNRGTRVFVDGKSVADHMKDRLERGDEDGYQTLYHNKLDEMSAEIVSSALRDGKRVEVAFDGPDGTIIRMPVQLKDPNKKTLYEQYSQYLGLDIQELDQIKGAETAVSKQTEIPSIEWNWQNHKLVGIDTLQQQYIEIAKSKMAIANRDDEFSRIIGFGKEFPNGDSSGMFSRVEMGIVQRLKRLKLAKKVCTAENEGVLNRFFFSASVRFLFDELTRGDARTYCEGIWYLRELAKHYPERFGSEDLEDLADRVERNASKAVPAIGMMDRILTIMERVAGLADGELTQEEVNFCNNLDPALGLMVKIDTGSSVSRVVPTQLEIKRPSLYHLGNIRMQEAAAAPENLNEYEWVRNAARELLTVYYRPLEKVYGRGTADKHNRGMGIFVNNKSVWELMREKYDKEFPNQSQGFPQWYDNHLDEMSAELVAEALLAEKKVSAQIPISGNAFKEVPIQLKKPKEILFDQYAEDRERWFPGLDEAEKRTVKQAKQKAAQEEKKRIQDAKKRAEQEKVQEISNRSISLVSKAFTQTEIAEVKAAEEQAGRAEVAKIAAEKKKLFRWESGQLMGGDLVQEAYAQIALARVASLGQRNQYSPKVERDFVQRLKQLKEAASKYTGKHKEQLDEFLKKDFLGGLCKGTAKAYCEKIRLTRDAAIVCPNRPTSKALQKLASKMEENALQCLSIKKMDDELKKMERLVAGEEEVDLQETESDDEDRQEIQGNSRTVSLYQQYQPKREALTVKEKSIVEEAQKIAYAEKKAAEMETAEIEDAKKKAGEDKIAAVKEKARKEKEAEIKDCPNRGWRFGLNETEKAEVTNAEEQAVQAQAAEIEAAKKKAGEDKAAEIANEKIEAAKAKAGQKKAAEIDERKKGTKGWSDVFLGYFQKQYTEEEQKEIADAQEHAGKVKAAEIYAKNDGRFRWVDNQLVTGDPVQQAYAQIALERAECADQNDDYPHILGLAYAYLGEDPCGKFSRIEMRFAQRLEQLRMVASGCTGQDKEVLDQFFATDFLKVLSQGEAGAYCRKIRLTRNAAKFCTDKTTSRKLEALANWMEDPNNMPPILQKMDQVLTVMEMVAHMKSGQLKEDDINQCALYVKTELMSKLPADRDVRYIAPETWTLQIPDDATVERILLQEAIAAPENLGKFLEDISIADEEQTREEYMRRYVNTAMQNAVTTFFGAAEQMEDTKDGMSLRTPNGLNLGTMVLVDDKPVVKYMRGKIAFGRDEETFFQMWYHNNLDYLGTEIVYDALRTGKQVELCVPGAENGKRVRVQLEMPETKLSLFEEYRELRGELNKEDIAKVNAAKAACKGKKRTRNIQWRDWRNDDRPRSEDALEDAFLKIAFSRATEAYLNQVYEYPHLRGLEQAFLGEDPYERYSRVDMGFAQRMERLKLAGALCDNQTQDWLRKILDSTKFANMERDVAAYCWKIRTTRDMAKYCPNKIISRSLEKVANQMEASAVRDVQEVHEMDQILTIMEQLVGIQGGKIGDDEIKLCKKFDQSIALTTETKTGYYVNRSIPKVLQIQMPSISKVERILNQEKSEHPAEPEMAIEEEVLMLGQGELVASSMEGIAIEECRRRCVDAAIQDMLNVYFDPLEKRVGGTRTSSGQNRGTMLFVGGKKVSDWMWGIYNQFDDAQKNAISFEDWYEKNLDRLSVERVSAALMARENVEVHVSGLNSKIDIVPVTLKKPDMTLNSSLFNRCAKKQKSLTPEEKNILRKAKSEWKGPCYQIIGWTNDIPTSTDLVQNAFIQIAYMRYGAKRLGNRSDLEIDFPGKETIKKFSQVANGLDQRVKTLINYRWMCPEPNRYLLSKMLLSETFRDLQEDVKKNHERILRARGIAKHCLHEPTSNTLEKMAETMLQGAVKNDAAVWVVDRILTVMERMVGLGEGKLDLQDIEACRKYVPDLKWSTQIETGETAKLNAPAKIEINPTEGKDTVSNDAVKDTLTTLFSLDEVKPRISRGVNRGTMLLVDGQSVKQLMHKHYDNEIAKASKKGDNQTGQKTFDEWYDENLDQMSAELVTKALNDKIPVKAVITIVNCMIKEIPVLNPQKPTPESTPKSPPKFPPESPPKPSQKHPKKPSQQPPLLPSKNPHLILRSNTTDIGATDVNQIREQVKMVMQQISSELGERKWYHNSFGIRVKQGSLVWVNGKTIDELLKEDYQKMERNMRQNGRKNLVSFNQWKKDNETRQIEVKIATALTMNQPVVVELIDLNGEPYKQQMVWQDGKVQLRSVAKDEAKAEKEETKKAEGKRKEKEEEKAREEKEAKKKEEAEKKRKEQEEKEAKEARKKEEAEKKRKEQEEKEAKEARKKEEAAAKRREKKAREEEEEKKKKEKEAAKEKKISSPRKNECTNPFGDGEDEKAPENKEAKETKKMMNPFEGPNPFGNDSNQGTSTNPFDDEEETNPFSEKLVGNYSQEKNVEKPTQQNQQPKQTKMESTNPFDDLGEDLTNPFANIGRQTQPNKPGQSGKEPKGDDKSMKNGVAL